MKKKSGILLFIILVSLVLAGWGKNEVRLLDSSKLIDLGKAIELAKPGGMAGESGEDQGGDPSDTGKGSGSENRTSKRDLAAKNIVIRIRGDRISYICGNLSRENIPVTQLESTIRSDFVSGARVTLNDDFAEAHVYKAVREILDGLKTNIGLNYAEVQLNGGE